MQAPTLEKGLSLAERLQAGREQKQSDGEFVGTIQYAGGHLAVYYRALDYREDRRIGQRHRMVSDELEREVRLGADTLACASVRTEAHVDGEVHELPALGLGLAEALGLDGPENDLQAVLEVFPSERAMMEQFLELEQWTAALSRAVDEELSGNS